MFHVMAFEEDVANVANTELDLIADGVALPEAGQAYFQRDMDIVFAYASAPNLQRARLNSPKLRQIFIPHIIPLNGALLPATDPNVMDLRQNPLRVRGLERFVPEVTNGVVGPERAYCVLGVTDGLTIPPSGEMFTIRGTATTTLVQGQWVDLTVTWDEQIAEGTYDVVGGHVFSATGVAWRLFNNEYPLRGGGLCINALANRTHKMFYSGGLGTLVRFRNTKFPIVQVMANAGDVAETVLLQVVRTGP